MAEYTGECWDPEFEVSKEDWNNVIEKLGALETLDPDERSEIEEAITEMELCTEEIVSSMEYFLENADPNNDSLHLCYF